MGEAQAISHGHSHQAADHENPPHFAPDPDSDREFYLKNQVEIHPSSFNNKKTFCKQHSDCGDHGHCFFEWSTHDNVCICTEFYTGDYCDKFKFGLPTWLLIGAAVVFLIAVGLGYYYYSYWKAYHRYHRARRNSQYSNLQDPKYAHRGSFVTTSCSYDSYESSEDVNTSHFDTPHTEFFS